MTRIARPRTIEQATELLARYAANAAQIGALDANRQAAIAATDAVADALVAPLAEEQTKIEALLAPWWAEHKAALTKGKRKSVDLGGCNIGTRTASEKVEFAHGDDKAALAAVLASPHKGKATALKRVLDKVVIAKLLGGTSAAAVALRALGFGIAGGGETFFIKRIDSAEAKATAR